MVRCGFSVFMENPELNTTDKFFERYNRGEDPNDIKNDLLLEESKDDKYKVIFDLANCMWEVGQLDEKFLLEIREIIDNREQLILADESGVNTEYLKKRGKNLEKTFNKLSVKKEKPKKRVPPPIPVETKYKTGTIIAFKYDDGTWGALIVLNAKCYDRETYQLLLQTTVKTSEKPTMEDVLNAHILDEPIDRKLDLIDSIYCNEEEIPYPHKYDYRFVYCICVFLDKGRTKRFEKYNDGFFEIIGRLSEWGECFYGFFWGFSYRQKTIEEFKNDLSKSLRERFEQLADEQTRMTVAELDKEFISRRQ